MNFTFLRTFLSLYQMKTFKFHASEIFSSRWEKVNTRRQTHRRACVCVCVCVYINGSFAVVYLMFLLIVSWGWGRKLDPMKLENIDVAKLQLEKIPKFETCPCELCDDGCFDRAGYKHHPECRRKASQRTKASRATRCPLTHYQATFLAAIDPQGQPEDHRRYPFAPPPDNDIPISFRNGSMSGLSSQQAHYQAPPLNALKKGPEVPVKRVTVEFLFFTARTDRFSLM